MAHSFFQNLDVWPKYSAVPSRGHIRYTSLQYFASAQIVDVVPRQFAIFMDSRCKSKIGKV
jgi:hypothetical protein